MTAQECINNIKNTTLSKYDLKYCFVTANKLPVRYDGQLAKSNEMSDFVDFESLAKSPFVNKFVGVGISINASGICAVDVDDCFEVANDFTTADERALDILCLFKDIAYCEFSFSGKGLRVLFKNGNDFVFDKNKYYIKNTKRKVEFYTPKNSARYVTVTGNAIFNNELKNGQEIIDLFLNKYMLREIKIQPVKKIDKVVFEECLKKTKRLYLKDMFFQDLWFVPAPGSGKDESERDYRLVAVLFENITQDRETLKKVFECSEFFKTKDFQHVKKWTSDNNRYYNYLFDKISASHFVVKD